MSTLENIRMAMDIVDGWGNEDWLTSSQIYTLSCIDQMPWQQFCNRFNLAVQASQGHIIEIDGAFRLTSQATDDEVRTACAILDDEAARLTKQADDIRHARAIQNKEIEAERQRELF